ncbi:hypothetical protein LIER_35896 [Lithospermum erythrorhizon]|uniref:Reverse transcriptase domain-containing protein n=1 Tax=Lithospermum erythrorhizon TaxID=34254 RepID=A0AAV3NY48_LITER
MSVNGSLQGHFRSTRGLRHGDPLSPYLFILVMECFTQMLQAQRLFNFYPQCEKTNYLYDNWHCDGIVVEKLTDRCITLLRIEGTDSVANVWNKIKWTRGRMHNVEIQGFRNDFPNQLEKEEDVLKWFGADSHKNTIVECLACLNRLLTRVHFKSWNVI